MVNRFELVADDPQGLDGVHLLVRANFRYFDPFQGAESCFASCSANFEIFGVVVKNTEVTGGAS